MRRGARHARPVFRQGGFGTSTRRIRGHRQDRSPLWDERGATAILVAAGMVLFLGMAALAVDYGLGVNERRADQTAADAGVTAGAVDALNGGDAVRDGVLDYVRSNLPTIYSAGDWQALWEGCVDPAAERNDGGFNFVALDPPTGWSVTDPANWCISTEAARGLIRVRVPDQAVDTAFSGIIGVDELTTRATAVARIGNRGQGGILPFGLPAGLGNGGHVCLSSGPTGQAMGPCEGSQSGNFGTLKGRIFGNPDLGTTASCNPNPNVALAQNIAHGYDHLVIPDKDGSTTNEVRDLCFNPFVDTLNTDTGFPNNGAEEGLVGPVPGGFTPRLQLTGPFTSVFGNQVNNTPLWSYLVGGSFYDDVTAPASCDPAGFDTGTFDWDGDGNDDSNSSWQHMQACLTEYASGAYSAVMFSSSLGANPARFGYVPEFWETSLGTGNSWRHIKRFRAVYLQTTTWKRGNNYVFHNPGEPCSPCSGNYSMRQLSAFVIPDAALPEEVRGDPPPGATGINPFTVELYG